MLTGAIFDFDGTLFDSMSVWNTIGADYLISIGYEPREDINEAFKPLSLYQAACYYISEYGVTLSVDEIMRGVNAMVESFYMKKAMPKPGAAELLESFRQGGVKMCIATATDEYLIAAALERCGLTKYFGKIFTCTEVGMGKGSPLIYQTALSYLGTDISKTLVFEDLAFALKTAKEGGFKTVGVYDRYEKPQKEVMRYSDFYIKSFENLGGFWSFTEGF